MDERDLIIQKLRAENKKLREQIRVLSEEPSGFYDVEEIHPDCTVQVLRNSETGAVSVGWWENER